MSENISIPMQDFSTATQLFDELKQAHWNKNGTSGMNAYGYTKYEQQAIDIVVRKAVDLGMEAFSDLAGNMYLIKRGKDSSKTNVVVSHVDTVEKGGAYDGRDGVVAGLVVADWLKDITPPNDLCVMIARSEESDVNGLVSIGAKAATGDLRKDDLRKLKNKVSGLFTTDHMEKIGIPVAQLEGRLDASPTLFPTGNDAKNLIGFLVEAHIEQGKYCAKQDINVGIVKSIRGNTRFLGAKITGEAAHSGATFHEDRADAELAYIKLMASANEWYENKRKTHDIVFTPSMASNPNNSATTISNEKTFSFEIRSSEKELLEEFAVFIKDEAVKIMDASQNKKLQIMLPKPKINPPAVMDGNAIKHAQEVARKLGIDTGIVTSGAGHDTAQFANTGTPSVMLFIRQDNPISHNPDESHDVKSFQNACKIIAGMVMTPAIQTARKPTETREMNKNFRDYIIEQGAKPYTPGQWQKT